MADRKHKQQFQSDPALYAPDAEQNVLGACLLNPDAYYPVSAILSEGDFALDANRIVWRAMEALAIAGRTTADITLVARYLADHGHTVGPAYLTELVARTPTSYHAEHYAHVVADKARRRRLLEAAGRVGRLAGDTDVDDPVAEAMALILDVPERRSDIVTSRTAWSDYLDMMSQRAQAGGIVGLRSGFTDIDQRIGGLRPGRLVVVGGRPGMGKTTFAECVAEYVAERGGRVLFANLEMSVEELQDRRMVRWTHLPLRDIERGRHVEQLAGVVGQHAEEQIDYVVDGGLTTDKLLAIAYRERMKARLDLVVVDYVQLLNDDLGRGQNDTARITYISRRLKMLARTVGVPVMALSQLNRDVERRQDKHPTLADLRQSGAIEQDADVVMLLYRESYYDKDCGHNVVEFDVAKNRFGTTGKIDLIMRPEWYQFFSMERERDGDAA